MKFHIQLCLNQNDNDEENERYKNKYISQVSYANKQADVWRHRMAAVFDFKACYDC